MFKRLMKAVAMAGVGVYSAAVLLVAVHALGIAHGLDYDATTRQTKPSTCDMCRTIDPDHCWDCWGMYYMSGCGLCPSEPLDGK